MKGKLDDGTPVDIEKPEPIEQDRKWWEFTEYRSVKMGDHYLYEMQDGVGYCIEDHRNVFLHWIASEIPRATVEQLRAIGMKERDGRPVKITPENYKDIIWTGNADSSFAGYVSGYKENIGQYRFVLVPDVQPKKHTTCSGCYYEWAPGERVPISCDSCFDWYNLFGVRKNYTTTQPPRPEEPKFSVGEIKNYLATRINMAASKESNENLIIAVNEICDPINGIKAFTERRRG